MRNDDFMSIIIPVYNVEKYLHRCIDSLMAQCEKRQNIEIILVDDGSTDGSSSICDTYTNRFPAKIRTIHQKKSGPASARNAGLNAAHGKYILFVDSDDIVSGEYIENIEAALSENPDLLVFGHEIHYTDTNEVITVDAPFKGKTSVQNAILALEATGAFNVVWNKAYKKDILEIAPQTRFEIGTEPGEDLLFNISYFEKTCLSEGVDKRLYYYMRQNEDTQANTFREDLIQKNKKFIRARTDFYSEMNFTDDMASVSLAKGNIDYVFSAIPNMYRGGCRTVSKNERIAYYKEIMDSADVNRWMSEIQPQSGLIKIFHTLYGSHSPRLMDSAFSIMMWARYRFEGIWNRLRRKLT